MRVLIVEDDPPLALFERRAFEAEGFEVRVCGSERSGIRLIRVWKPDIVLLDHHLPDARGRDSIHEIRRESTVPIIVVTANAFEHDRVASLEAGADDFVTKPFSVPELIARTRAVLRRSGQHHDDRRQTLSFKDVTVQLDLRRVVRADEEIELTRTEFDMLRVVLEAGGAVVTRDELARAVWNQPGTVVGKPLDVHMSLLRKKLGDDARTPRYIRTVRGVGFRLASDDLRSLNPILSES